MLKQIRRIFTDFSLLSLVDCSLTMLGASLLFSFVKRWHNETSCFHISFRKMSVTLDYVFIAHVINQNLAYITATRDLGVTEEFLLKEFVHNTRAHFHTSWLWNRYIELVEW